MIDIDPMVWAIVAGPLVPILVGLLTKLSASAGLKAFLNLALSAVSAVIANVVPTNFDGRQFILSFALAFSTSIASYYGFLKPTGTAAAVQTKTAGIGVG